MLLIMRKVCMFLAIITWWFSFVAGCQPISQPLIYDFSSGFQWLPNSTASEKIEIITTSFDFNENFVSGCDRSGNLYLFNLDKRKLVSKLKAGTLPYRRAKLSKDGILYFASANGAFAWDLLHKKLLWEVKGRQSKAKPAIHDSIVIFHLDANGKYEASIQAFNRFTGESIWKINGAYWTPAEFVIQDSILYVTGFSGFKELNSETKSYNKILAVKCSKGVISWNFELGSQDNSARRPVFWGDTMLVGAGIRGLLLLDSHSGELLDSIPSLSMEYWSPIFAHNGVVYYQDYEYNKYCAYDLEKRTFIWKTEMNYHSTDFYPILHKGFLYLTYHASLVRLDIQNGQIDENFSSFMVKCGHIYDDKLWVISPSGGLYLIE